jgi:hypothetical protein
MICYHDGLEVFDIRVVGNQLHFWVVGLEKEEHTVELTDGALLLDVIQKYLDRAQGLIYENETREV